MAETKRRVGIFDAHSAIARSLVEAIEERELELELFKTTTNPHLGSGLDLISEAAVDRAELWVIVGRDPLSRRIADVAHMLRKPVIDLAEASVDHPRARRIWPVLHPESAKLILSGPHPGLCRIAVGLPGPIALVLAALREFGPKRVVLSTLESAAAFDQEGLDQLSEEVRAVFTMKEVEESVFPARLAFSAIPAPEEEEQKLEALLAEALPELELSVAATRMIIPTFSAEGATLELELSAPIEAEQVAAAFKKGRGLRYTPERFSLAEALERDDALVGRLRLRAPDRLSVGLAADRLRHGSVTPAILALEQWLG